jgi:mannose-6-phosphate isomerase-like protein (cupin superfamily)
MNSVPLLPGATGVTHLKVYDSLAPDGLHGGSPHMHFTCTEAYWIIKGRGQVQTLSANGFHETPLAPGQLTWFSPGVIHRLVNLDGELEILVVMQNAGLPEAGDFVLTFPPDVLSNPTTYAKHAALGASNAVFASGDDAARSRRDLAVEGFNQLCTRFEREGESALRAFYEAAFQIVCPQFEKWRRTWRGGPLHAVQATEAQLNALEVGDISHLFDGRLATLPRDDARKLGMCGSLGTYLPEGLAV